MNFDRHLNLKGCHATFSASQCHWLNYTDEKILDKVKSDFRKDLGTIFHDYAATDISLCIRHTSTKSVINGIKEHIYRQYYNDEIKDISPYGKKLISQMRYIPKESYDTIKDYITDAIGFNMTPEQPLYYSKDFFGTTDAISFKNNELRIHDLKTGSGPVHPEQLMVYAALFCLEYKQKPKDLTIELRIYQNNEISIFTPPHEEIENIMRKIIAFNNLLEKENSKEG